MLALVAVLALCGYAFGYLATEATLFDAVRAGLERKSVTLWKAWLSPDARHTPSGWVRVHVLDGLLCPVCAGWWATGAAALWLSTVGGVDLDGAAPAWLAVTFAACGAQTAAHRILNTGSRDADS